MADLGVALTWIALSAVSAKGLSVFARAAALSNAEAEFAALQADGGSEQLDRRPIDAQFSQNAG